MILKFRESLTGSQFLGVKDLPSSIWIELQKNHLVYTIITINAPSYCNDSLLANFYELLALPFKRLSNN